MSERVCVRESKRESGRERRERIGTIEKEEIQFDLDIMGYSNEKYEREINLKETW